MEWWPSEARKFYGMVGKSQKISDFIEWWQRAARFFAMVSEDLGTDFIEWWNISPHYFDALQYRRYVNALE
jgi:hypothetical protein